MGDIMQTRLRIAATLMTVVTASGLLTATAATAQAASTHAQAHAAQAAPQYSSSRHLEARLYGSSAYRSVRGHADYQSYGYRHLEVSLWNARNLAGYNLVVYANGRWAGTMNIWGGGSGHFYRTRGVPTCWSGAPIRVRTHSGRLVASGTFYRMGMM